MDNLTEIVALLRKQADLEIQIMNGRGTAVATERELEATCRRLVAHPQADFGSQCIHLAQPRSSGRAWSR
jgi:hypothetical protein